MIESSPVLSLTKVKRQKEVKWRDQILRTSNRVGVWDPGKSLQWPIKTWVMVFPFNWPGVLQATGSHRDGHDWATELKWTELNWRVFPSGSDSKESACNAGDMGVISGLGRSLGEGNVNPLQYSCVEIPVDIGAWWAMVHVVSKKLDTTERLNDNSSE